MLYLVNNGITQVSFLSRWLLTDQNNLSLVVRPWLFWILWLCFTVVAFSALVVKNHYYKRHCKCFELFFARILEEQAWFWGVQQYEVMHAFCAVIGSEFPFHPAMPQKCRLSYFQKYHLFILKGRGKRKFTYFRISEFLEHRTENNLYSPFLLW